LVAVIFLVTALCWIFQPLLSQWSGLALSDTVIALSAAMLLFLLPVQHPLAESLAAEPAPSRVQPVLNWQDSEKLPWGVLLLFGGGLSLAGQLQQHGVSDALAQWFQGLHGVPALLIIAAVALLIVFLTELTSNTAVAAAFLPILGPVALSLDLSPLYLLVPAALAASLGFMMPVGTPPNAIVFASGQLNIRDMIKAGVVLNFAGVLLITLWCQLVLPFWL
jgi:sodium-dependent dicarboxylate transporter 2/3/5